MNYNEQIPRIIHYCWFGQGKLPELAQKCIASWKKYLIGFQFIEWNEKNFDINSIRYVNQAYNSKKFAFVSDYVRLFALYKYGGIYMDTDVEVLRSLDPFLKHTSFSGFEDELHVPTAIMGSIKQHPWIEELLNYYIDRDFVKPDGTLDMTTNTKIITENSQKYGLKLNGEYQELRNGVAFYPRSYFCPYDYINCKSFISNDSYTIHHFAKSWLPLHVRLKSQIKKYIANCLGPKTVISLRNLINRGG